MSLRVERVRELIRRELGVILEQDVDFSGSFVTIHQVDLTHDLKQCFVYVGVLTVRDQNQEEQEQQVLSVLQKKRGSIQRALYKRVILRNSPQLFFRIDRSVARGVRLVQIMEDLPEPLPDEEPEPDTIHSVDTDD